MRKFYPFKPDYLLYGYYPDKGAQDVGAVEKVQSPKITPATGALGAVERRLPLAGERITGTNPTDPLIEKWRGMISRYQLSFHAIFLAGNAGDEETKKAVEQRKVLDDEALTLFKKAFIEDNPENEAKINWNNFSRLIQSSRITDAHIDLLLRLGGAYIMPADRKLLFEIAHATSTLTEKQQDELENKIIYYWKSCYAKYDGWSSAAGSIYSNAFFDVLKSACSGDINRYEGLLTAAFSKKLGRVLNTLGGDELTMLLNLSQADLAKQLNRAGKEMIRLPIGTQPKIEAARRYQDIKAVYLAKGFSLHESVVNEFMSSIEGISRESALLLAVFQEAAESPGNNDNNVLAATFRQVLLRVQNEYLDFNKCTVGSEIRKCYAEMLFYLYGFAPEFMSKQDIDQSLRQLQKRGGIDKNIKVSTLAELEQIKSPVTVGPQGLPVEAIEVLKKTGYYDFVAGNMREITFTPSIIDRNSPVDYIGGQSFSAIGLIEVLVVPGISKYQIAEIIVHETFHNYHYLHCVGKESLRSTPDERNAYLASSKFIRWCLEQKDLTPDELVELSKRLVLSDFAVGVANQALGYPLDFGEYRYSVEPPQEFLAFHGLSSPKELDMNNYPTNLATAYVDSAFGEISNEAGFTKDEEAFARDLLDGKRRLYVNAKVLPLASGISDPEMVEMLSADKAGCITKLNRSEALIVNGIIDKAYAAITGEKADNNSKFRGLALLLDKANQNSCSRLWSRQMFEDMIRKAAEFVKDDETQDIKARFPGFMESIIKDGIFPCIQSELGENELNYIFNLAIGLAAGKADVKDQEKLRQELEASKRDINEQMAKTNDPVRKKYLESLITNAHLSMMEFEAAIKLYKTAMKYDEPQGLACSFLTAAGARLNAASDALNYPVYVKANYGSLELRNILYGVLGEIYAKKQLAVIQKDRVSSSNPK